MSHTSLKHIYTTTIPIRFADVDEYGHVNHAQYVVLLQEARLKWLQNVEQHEKFTYLFPIIEMNIQYRKALNFPGNCIINLLSEPPSKKIWTLHHEVYREDDPNTLYASAWIKSVCYNPKSQKTITLPDRFKNALYIP